MNEILASIGWVAIGILLMVMISRRYPPEDRRYIWGCFWAHIFSAFMLLWLTHNVLGGGDLEMYYRYGDLLADFVRRDPGRWAPEVVRLIFQFPADLPISIYGTEGSSTTTMTGITCFVLIVSGGSEYATGIAFSLLALSGQFGMYAAFRRHFPPVYRTRFLIAILLVPSAVFWTSGVVKEAVAIGGMGWMIWGLNAWIVRHRRLPALVTVAIGGVLVSISKAYVLFPMAAAAGLWWYWHYSMSTKGSVGLASSPMYLVAGAVVAIAGVIGLGELFPQYSVDALGEEAAELQYQGQRVQGGSSYAIGDPTETSTAGQLAFAPVAIFSALFRPMIVEAHNIQAAINGLEMLIVKVLWIRILWVRGIRGTWRMLSSSPALMFCVVFILLFSLGIGLATTNLGTLSRYRVPMMPMYALVLLMLWPTDDGPG